MYNFKRLISKYTKSLPKLKTVEEGYRDYENGGVWIEGNVTFKEFQGAVLPLGEDLVIDNAAYTTDDKKLYTYEDVANNQTVIYKDREYTTMNFRDYEDFDNDLKIFILKAGGKDD